MIDVSAAATGARDRVGGQYPSVYGLGNNVRIHRNAARKHLTSVR